MKHSSEYLRNQGRRLYSMHRRQRLFRNVFLALWTTLFALLLIAAILGPLAGLGWGYGWPDALLYLGFIAAGGLLWTMSALIQKALRAKLRHDYGPEPVD